MALTILVGYDVVRDGRRARLAALLQAWGNRIQYSLFVCSLEPEQGATLVAEMGKIIDSDEDSVYVIRQCKVCWESLITLGQGQPPTAELLWQAF